MGQLEKPYTPLNNYATIKWQLFHIIRRLFLEGAIILPRCHAT